MGSGFTTRPGLAMKPLPWQFHKADLPVPGDDETCPIISHPMAKQATGLVVGVEAQARAAHEAALALQAVPTARKNAALEAIAHEVEAGSGEILEANEKDLAAARKAKASEAILDRLELNKARVQAMAKAVHEVVALPDPVGEVSGRWRRPNGLRIMRQRVPIGVIAFIYEARPNVTVDAAALCLKAGNAVILKGGSEAINSNRVLVSRIARGLAATEFPAAAVQFLDTTDRAAVPALVKMDRWVDLCIPRGSEDFIQFIKKEATVPVLGHGKGLCHVYVDRAADLKMAENVVFNAKVSRPGVCNAMETLLVHADAAPAFLPKAAERLVKAGVELRGDEKARAIVPSMKAATGDDWDEEYLALVLSVKVVATVEEAIEHINRHSSRLSESIISADRRAVKKFMDQVDSAVVYHNASTRFTDGGEFGFGAEIGISNARLHARGPMGLKELTTHKYLVYGDGQVRE